jgi:hypothetical protein
MIHGNGVLQGDMGKEIADAVLRELFDIVTCGPAAENDALGKHFDRQMANAAASADLDHAFEFGSQLGWIREFHGSNSLPGGWRWSGWSTAGLPRQ